jgi:hypothetical protein
MLETALLLCLIAAVCIPAARLLFRTTKDMINAATEFNSHSAVAQGDAPGTPVYAYGEQAPAGPDGGDPPDWPVE